MDQETASQVHTLQVCIEAMGKQIEELKKHVQQFEEDLHALKYDPQGWSE